MFSREIECDHDNGRAKCWNRPIKWWKIVLQAKKTITMTVTVMAALLPTVATLLLVPSSTSATRVLPLAFPGPLPFPEGIAHFLLPLLLKRSFHGSVCVCRNMYGELDYFLVFRWARFGIRTGVIATFCYIYNCCFLAEKTWSRRFNF